MDKTSIHDVVLVGGSTRIPKVQQLLQDFFNGKELCKNLHPDEAVASGAAVQAAVLSGQGNHGIQNLILHEVTPLSLGVGIIAGQMLVVVPRNTAFPITIGRDFYTSYDSQTVVGCDLYEGERPRVSDNFLLGKIVISNIPPAPRAFQVINICFDIDADGILVVSAEHIPTGRRSSINVDAVRPTGEIHRMLKDMETHKVEDERQRRRFEMRTCLEDYIYCIRDTMYSKRSASQLQASAAKKIRQETRDALRWLNENESAEADALESKRKELESHWNLFLTRD